MKICLFGISEIYNMCYHRIKWLENNTSIEIVGITASQNLYSYDKLDEWPIYTFDEIQKLGFDYIIVMAERNFKFLVEQFVKLGINKNKILKYNFLFIPNLDIEEYLQLKNSNISIISMNCWGGLICHSLGIECLSPFKNLFFEGYEYIKLLKNLKYYMQLVPQFESYYYSDDQHRYPILTLDQDIHIMCNHDVNMDPAVSIERWKAKAKQINYNNLFVQMYTDDVDLMNQFLDLAEFDKKICFVSFRTERPQTCYIPPFLNPRDTHNPLWERVNKTAKEMIYDPVKLLNSGDLYLRT